MEFFKEADVVVIGGGIVGTAILRELSKYDLHCLLVEKEPDVAVGTTKANSAICHAGFDAPTGTLKQKTNVRGNALYHQLQEELDLDIKWTGSLVVATNDEEIKHLQVLLERGRANGVPGLKILSREEVLNSFPGGSAGKRAEPRYCAGGVMGAYGRCDVAFWLCGGLCPVCSTERRTGYL